MSDPTSAFFDELSARGSVPLLKGTSGAIRFDLEDGARTAHWHVTIKKGDVTVTRESADADCVVGAPRELFDRMAAGTANATAAALRGLLKVTGDLNLVIQFQRLFPGPPRDQGERGEAGYSRRQS
jgi:predicted lipid carrier protein YhbT